MESNPEAFPVEALNLQIERLLLPLSPESFRETAERLLDQAQHQLALGHPEFALAISSAVSRAAKGWAQRHGELGVYSEGLTERAHEFQNFLGGPPR